MSGRFRRSYWNFNSRRRFARGRYSGRRVGTARRARGNQRAANQQNDISNVTINMMKKVKAGVLGFQNNNIVYEVGTCALNIFELLKKSDFYQSYSNMYDQFRINRIQVKVTPVTWQTYNQFNVPSGISSSLGQTMDENPKDFTDVSNTGNPQYPSVDADGSVATYGGVYADEKEPSTKFIVPQALTVVTAWDRTGLDSTQIFESTIADVSYLMTNIGDKITTYSSAKSTQLVAGANFNCVRYLYPSSQQEKSLYFSTSELVDQILKPDNNQKWYCHKKAADYKSSYITNLHSDPNCPFKPTFLIGVLKVEDLKLTEQDAQHINPEAALGQIAPVTFNLEFDIGVTFRGLRKTQVV